MQCKGCGRDKTQDGEQLELREGPWLQNGQYTDVALCPRCYVTNLGATYPIRWADARELTE